MNILILSWRGPGHPQSGGAEQATLAHAARWVKACHSVTLFTSSFVKAKSNEIIAGVKIIRWGDQFIGVRIAAFFWYWFGDHLKIDLLIDEFHGIPFFTPIWVLRSKILAFIHEVASPVWHLNPWPKPFNLIPATIGKFGEPWMFRLLYKNIQFMTVSESTKTDLERFGIKNVTVINNGVTLPKVFSQTQKEKLFTVMYLSPLAKDKGIEDGITAFKRYFQTNKDSQMWVAGKCDGKYLLELTKLTINYPITFWGFVSELKKFELLSRAHVLLNPSIHEGWGLVNIEANACGTPVVGYDVSGMRDSVVNGKTGILVDVRNIEQVSRAISEIKEGLIMGIDCKKWASKFSWDKSTSNSLKLITSL